MMKLRSGFLKKASGGEGGRTCVVLLNHDLPRCTERLWREARTRVCADGGATLLRDLGGGSCPPPDFIVGDLDSVTADTLEHYKSLGTQVVDLSHDQDTTDLEKCYRVILDKTDFWREANAEASVSAANDDDDDRGGDVLLILGAFGGKFDREMSNLNVVLKYGHLNSVLIGCASLARVITPGKAEILLDFDVEGPGCSLIPLCGEAVVTTTGLKWNLNKEPLSFGNLVSTSNEAVEERVTVETDKAIVWSTDSNL